MGRIEHLGLVVRGAERARDGAVEQLPIRLLGIAEPQRVLAARGRPGQQARSQLGARRQLDAHLMLLVALGLGRAAAGRIGLECRHGCRTRWIPTSVDSREAESAAVRAGLELVVARDLAVARVAAAAVGRCGGQGQTLVVVGCDHGCRLGRCCRGVDGACGIGVGQAPVGAGRSRERLLMLGPGVEAGQACLVVGGGCALAPALRRRRQLRPSCLGRCHGRQAAECEG